MKKSIKKEESKKTELDPDRELLKFTEIDERQKPKGKGVPKWDKPPPPPPAKYRAKKIPKVLTEAELEAIAFVAYTQPDFGKFEPAGKSVRYDKAKAIYLANHLRHINEIKEAKELARTEKNAAGLKFMELTDRYEALILAKAENDATAVKKIELLEVRVLELTGAADVLLKEAENLAQVFEDLNAVMADVSEIKNK